MATLTLTGPAGRIAKLGTQLQAAAMERPDNTNISVTIDDSTFNVTAPSGKVHKS